MSMYDYGRITTGAGGGDKIKWAKFPQGQSFWAIFGGRTWTIPFLQGAQHRFGVNQDAGGKPFVVLCPRSLDGARRGLCPLCEERERRRVAGDMQRAEQLNWKTTTVGFGMEMLADPGGGGYVPKTGDMLKVNIKRDVLDAILLAVGRGIDPCNFAQARIVQVSRNGHGLQTKYHAQVLDHAVFDVPHEHQEYLGKFADVYDADLLYLHDYASLEQLAQTGALPSRDGLGGNNNQSGQQQGTRSMPMSGGGQQVRPQFAPPQVAQPQQYQQAPSPPPSPQHPEQVRPQFAPQQSQQAPPPPPLQQPAMQPAQQYQQAPPPQQPQQYQQPADSQQPASTAAPPRRRDCFGSPEVDVNDSMCASCPDVRECAAQQPQQVVAQPGAAVAAPGVPPPAGVVQQYQQQQAAPQPQAVQHAETNADAVSKLRAVMDQQRGGNQS